VSTTKVCFGCDLGWAYMLALALVVGSICPSAAQGANYQNQEAPYSHSTPPSIGRVQMSDLPQTIGLEHQDRVERFNRLAHLYGITPPQIDEMQLRPGQIPNLTYPIPIVRVIFDEGIFFDFNSDTLKPDADPIIAIVAENMQNDVPDAQLLILGHTDAIGSDNYNIDLSRRRATTVMRALMSRGVSPAQLATVAIGKSQPIASNLTEEGRAHNRRVEFMISANQLANIQLVHKRRIIESYLKVRVEEQPISAAKAEVLVPSPLASGQVELKPAGEVVLQKPTPLDIKLNQPTEYKKNSLDQEFVLD